MASVWDYDLVLMMVSIVNAAMNRYRAGKGKKPDRVVRPRIADIIRYCHRGRGGRQHSELVEACRRLNTTNISMFRTVKTKRGRVVRVSKGEPLISRYEIIENCAGIPESIEMELNTWMYREITEGVTPEVLTVHPNYFLIDGGIARFVYRLARQKAGTGHATWLFSTVYRYSGSAGRFKEFCRVLRRLILADDLPDYRLSEGKGRQGPLLTMTFRGKANSGCE